MSEADLTPRWGVRPLIERPTYFRALEVLGGSSTRLLTVGVLCAAGTSYLVSVLLSGWPQITFALIALILFGVTALLGTAALLRNAVVRSRLRMMEVRIENDPSPSLVSDAGGRVLARNAAARREGQAIATVGALVRPRVADPDALIARFQARRGGADVREEGIGREGRWRLSMQAVGPGLDL